MSGSNDTPGRARPPQAEDGEIPTVSLVDGQAPPRRRVAPDPRPLPPDIITMELELEGADAGPETAGVDTSSAPPPSRKVKRRLGRFSVIGTLGRGGMGTVLEAYDDTLARTVALKLLHGRVVRARRERLLREAQALAQLSHPNVVQVYEVGLVEDQMFIAMELVEGQNLRKWQKERRPWRQVIEVYQQAGRGLAAAHAEGLIHRDFKPENCIIGDNGRVCVLDFGLARGLRTIDDSTQPPESRSFEDSSLVQRLTQSGKVLGTLSYLPLQQLLGRPSDDKSDQFSFCVSLYEALYGVLPFLDRSVRTLMEAQQTRTFQPVPRGTGVPRRLRRILLRGLAQDPRDRWPCIPDLLTALERVLHPRRWRIAAAVSPLVIGFGAGAFAMSVKEEPCAKPEAALEGAWDQADKDAVRAAYRASGHEDAPRMLGRVEGQLDDYTDRWVGMYEESCQAKLLNPEAASSIDRRMQCLGRQRGRLRATIDALAGISTAPEALERTVLPFKLPVLESCNEPSADSDPPVSDALLRSQITSLRRQIDDANTLGEVGALEPAIDVATAAVIGARGLEHPRVLAEALETLGRLQARGSTAEEAEATLQEAIQVAAQAHDDSSAARAWSSLIYAVMVQHDFDRAESLGFAATAAVDRAGDEMARAWLLNNLGTLYGQQGQWMRACDLLEQALRVKQSILGPNHIDVGVAWFNLGHALQGDGRPLNAREAFEHARSILVGTVGSSHPHVASVEAGLGNLAFGAGRFDEAGAHHRRALRIREAALGPQDLQVAKSLEHLARTRKAQDRRREAAEHLRRALDIYQAMLGDESPLVALATLGLADIEWSRGRKRKARTLAERAMALLQTDGTDQERAQAQFMLARTLYALPRERARAHTLAVAARTTLTGEERTVVDDWLLEHPEPEPEPEPETETETETSGSSEPTPDP